MPGGKRSKPDIATYGDHEIITPDTTKLRKTVRAASPGEPDPVERAEAALAAISGDFSNWMHDECGRLDTARLLSDAKGLLADANWKELEDLIAQYG